MYCPFCGAKNDDDSIFCAECGKKIDDDVIEETSEDEAERYFDSEDEEEEQYVPQQEVVYEQDETPEFEHVPMGQPRKKPSSRKKKKTAGSLSRATGKALNGINGKKKVLPIIAAIFGLVIIILGVALFTSGIGSDDSEKREPFYGITDSGETAFVALLNGNHVKIDDVAGACVTPDRKRIVVISNSRELYYTDASLKNKVMIEDDLKDGRIVNVSDECVIFQKNEDYYVDRYSNEDPIRLATTYLEGLIVKKGNILYETEGNIYLLTRSSNEREKIGSYDGEGSLLYLSKDGKKAIWVESDTSESNKYNVYMYRNGEREKLCSPSTRSIPNLEMNQAETYGLLGGNGEDSFYVIDMNGDVNKVGMGNPVFSMASVFTSKERLSEDTSSSFPGVYVTVRNDPDSPNCALYYVDKSGEREKVISDIKSLSIRNGYLYYVVDDELRIARLDGCNLKKDEKIAHDVEGVIPVNGDCVFFAKDAHESNDGTVYGTIYVSKNGNDPVKVSDDAVLDTVYASADGRTLYYFIDPDYDTQSQVRSASLYKYVFGKKKSEKIADSVCVNALKDGTEDDHIDSANGYRLNDRFTYFEKIDHNDFQWRFYDGKNSITMVEGLGSESVR